MRRLTRALLCIFAICACADDGALAAAQQISRDESPFVLNVAGIPDEAVRYLYLGWTENYAAERFVLGHVDHGTGTQIYFVLTRLAPEYYFSHAEKLDEEQVRNHPLFRGKSVTFRERSEGLNALSDSAAAGPNYLLMSVDSQSCAYVRFASEMSVQEAKGTPDGRSVDGFYCAPHGSKPVTPAEALALAARGIRFVDKSGGTNPVPSISLPSLGK